MAGARKPGPLCAYNDPVDILDGTSCRAVSMAPGSIGGMLVIERSVGGSQGPGDSTELVLSAYRRALHLAPRAIFNQTGYSLGQIPGLFDGFQSLVEDAQPGASPASAILSSLRLGFLFGDNGSDLEQVVEPLRRGVASARGAAKRKGADRARELDRAVDELARAVALLMRLILNGIVNYQVGNNAAGSSGAKATVMEQLRLSNLASGFTAWVDENWQDLIQNARLKPNQEYRQSAEIATEEQALPAVQKSAPVKEKTWIVIRLIDQDGKPVSGQKYQVQLTDSSIQEGTLDSDGSARFDNIDPGQCKVRFPDIHGKEWMQA